MGEAAPATEDPKKKGGRGGKRSVTHLSKAQLQRKRANDREAQRSIRKRNKEHVSYLESRIALLVEKEAGYRTKVGELEDELRLESLERVKLEAEIRLLRAQLGQGQHATVQQQQQQHAVQHAVQHVVQHTVQQDQRVSLVPPDEAMVPLKFEQEWVPSPVDDHPVSTFPPTEQIFPVTMAFEDPEAAQQLYASTTVPVWDGTVGFEQVSHALMKTQPAWAPFQLPVTQPDRYNYSPVNHCPPLYAATTCWQVQPSSPVWQSVTKLKPPSTSLDRLLMAIIEAYRQLPSANVNVQLLLSQDIPPVQALLGAHPLPSSRMPPSLNKIMTLYKSLCSCRGFTRRPELLSSFVNMYRFIQRRVSPSYETYRSLYEWQRPLACQLTIPHPAWMDFPPWPAFRDKIIREQDRYDTPEFQRDYATNLNINFPRTPGAEVEIVNGEMRISERLKSHIADVRRASMGRAFAEKYPEFRDVCRFEEV